MCKPVYYALHEDECTALMSYKFWFNAKKKETKFQVGTQYKTYYLTRIGYDYMTIFGQGSIIVNIVINTLHFNTNIFYLEHCLSFRSIYLKMFELFKYKNG